MRDFIDLKGASGNSYRFRRWAEGAAHPPIAGNYALVHEDAGRLQVRDIGETHDLSELPHLLNPRETGVQMFTRLNVAKAIRQAEHEDLLARLRPRESGDAAGAEGAARP